MTLEQELRRLADDMSDKVLRDYVNELRSLADRVAGKVLAKPQYSADGPYVSFVAYIEDEEGTGNTPEEALADLQRHLEED